MNNENKHSMETVFVGITTGLMRQY